MNRLVFSFCLCLPLSGCLSPPAVPSSLLTRYHEAMVSRSPAERVGTRGLDLLKPVATEYLAPLDIKFVEDPETHEVLRFVIELSLDEAVRRALVNSLDIAVVSFDPGISREQMLEAAAQFDAVFFADFTYASDNEQVASAFAAGESKTRTWEAGLTQKTVTGATWAASWTMTRTWDNSTYSTLPKRYEPVLLLEISQPLLRDAWGQYNLANLRLARINHQITVAQFRQKVEEVITEVIATYWALVQARREVRIQEDLLLETTNTLRRVEARGELDATAVQIRQAEAATADRRAR
ncbi:MAG: TolC family protein, partial [Phycisphaerae bacterium]|nr:TolC family protein [Phycisphaerae bacterium]